MIAAGMSWSTLASVEGVGSSHRERFFFGGSSFHSPVDLFVTSAITLSGILTSSSGAPTSHLLFRFGVSSIAVMARPSSLAFSRSSFACSSIARCTLCSSLSRFLRLIASAYEL